MNITMTDEEFRKLTSGTRIAITSMLDNKTPYGCSIDFDTYWEYIAKYKDGIIRFLPVCYICMKHTHKDTYIHFAKREVLEQIIKDSYLSNELSTDECTLGKAIYTYPLRSGMFFYNSNIKDGAFLVFEAEAEHHHIVQTDDTPYGIGEADFLCEKLYIENPRIMTYEEIQEMSKKFFDWEYAKHNYFGLVTEENADYENMYSIIEKFN